MHSHIRETGQTVRERMGLLMGNIQQILSTRRYKLNVGVLRIDIDNDEQGILKVLPYLEPGAIETFAVITSSEDPISLDTIVELDQWKQMKRLLTNVNISLTFDKLKHFEEVNFHVEHLTSDMVKEIVTVGCFPRSSDEQRLLKSTCPFAALHLDPWPQVSGCFSLQII